MRVLGISSTPGTGCLALSPHSPLIPSQPRLLIKLDTLSLWGLALSSLPGSLAHDPLPPRERLTHRPDKMSPGYEEDPP